jgi:hypothetical protein
MGVGGEWCGHPEQQSPRVSKVGSKIKSFKEKKLFSVLNNF